MLITDHFDSAEFDCKDGTPYPVEWIERRLRPLCEALEVIRSSVSRPLYVSSGYRTPAYNRRIGGAKNSQHMSGRAADIRFEVYQVAWLHSVILDLIKKGAIPNGGVGVYPNFVHYDQRGSTARWRGGRKEN